MNNLNQALNAYIVVDGISHSGILSANSINAKHQSSNAFRTSLHTYIQCYVTVTLFKYSESMWNMCTIWMCAAKCFQNIEHRNSKNQKCQLNSTQIQMCQHILHTAYSIRSNILTYKSLGFVSDPKMHLGQTTTPNSEFRNPNSI